MGWEYTMTDEFNKSATMVLGPSSIVRRRSR